MSPGGIAATRRHYCCVASSAYVGFGDQWLRVMADGTDLATSDPVMNAAINAAHVMTLSMFFDGVAMTIGLVAAIS